ncbi:hypothetical protein BGZ60DRAFT_432421 [Tricladium varicosporioides]|nr:hypothetical protein BGZ60DRAFT_432421 [Hymenoscyphus varicosporioides]
MPEMQSGPEREEPQLEARTFPTNAEEIHQMRSDPGIVITKRNTKGPPTLAEKILLVQSDPEREKPHLDTPSSLDNIQTEEVLLNMAPLPPVPSISMKVLLDTLGSKKSSFLDNVQVKVSSYVSSTGTRCVAVIERKPFPRHDELHKVGVDEWIPVFIAFLRKKKYFNHELDSYLTGGITQIITECYMKFIEENSADINDFFYKQMTQNHMVQHAVLEHIAAQCIKSGVRKSRKAILHALAQALHAAVHSQIAHGVAHTVTHTSNVISAKFGTTAGATAGKAISKLMVKVLAKQIAVVSSKLIGHALLSKAIIASVGHSIAMTVTAIVIHTMIAHVGLSSVTLSIHYAAVAIITVYVLYKIVTLDRELGEKLGKSIRDSMEKNFMPITSNILDDIAKGMLSPDGLAKAMFSEFESSPDFKDNLIKIVGDYSATDTLKDAGKIYDKSKSIIESEMRVRRRKP